ncbi:hypothetical protein AMTR_s00059p00183820 [Amborella trichopoda]|uniref:Uncharacterized protein n=1 Tax=Amborella trichopoda TaxID=13333 RepID=U5D5D9_AMBTC|nr:hypothetical protein AMTR_s00059p00183820 [Amborella trichopoda]
MGRTKVTPKKLRVATKYGPKARPWGVGHKIWPKGQARTGHPAAKQPMDSRHCLTLCFSLSGPGQARPHTHVYKLRPLQPWSGQGRLALGLGWPVTLSALIPPVIKIINNTYNNSDFVDSGKRTRYIGAFTITITITKANAPLKK